MSRVKVVALGGSLRDGSLSLAAARVALIGAAKADAETSLLDVRDLNLPLFDGSSKPGHAGLEELLSSARDADGMLWSSPLYHGTVSGSFKNALDWLELLADDRPSYLTDKVVGLIATSGGVRAIQGINTLELAVHALRGWSAPLAVPIAQAYQAFDENGQPRDSEVEQLLLQLGGDVARAAKALGSGRACRPQ